MVIVTIWVPEFGFSGLFFTGETPVWDKQLKSWIWNEKAYPHEFWNSWE